MQSKLNIKGGLLQRSNEMECNCIEKMTEKIRVKTEDPKAYLNLDIITTGLFTSGKIIERPFVEYYYRKKKKISNDFTKKTFPGKLVFSYCPFCGKKIIE